MKIKNYVLLFVSLSLVFSLTGCEAFVKKFTRKSKKDRRAEEEMVLVPQEYPSLFKNEEEEYRQYFLYWQSWQDEFINALLYKSSHKKKLTCLDEALKNISHVRELLLAKKQKDLDLYIKQLKKIRDQLARDKYTKGAERYLHQAEKVKRMVSKNYNYSKIKGFLKGK